MTLNCMFILWIFFFFKQKTEYELRISDWSSDVCSSDLYGSTLPYIAAGCAVIFLRSGVQRRAQPVCRGGRIPSRGRALIGSEDNLGVVRRIGFQQGLQFLRGSHGIDKRRSEEHTSELQSLMRISYAVFC